MKNLFWILLLGNVILFAAMQHGWLGRSEQEEVKPDFHGDLIRLVPEPQSAPAKAGQPPKKSVVPPVAVTPPPPKPVVPPVVVSPPPRPASSPDIQAEMSAVKPGTQACLEWGEFSGPDLGRATAALSALKLGDKLGQRQVERDIGYWVYIPPLRNRAAVNRKIGELKALGIKEYFVVQSSGQWLNAVSLGVFKTIEAAQNFLYGLNAKGVHSARVGERTSKIKATIFMLNDVDAGTVSALTSMQNDFAGSELSNVPCTLTR